MLSWHDVKACWCIVHCQHCCHCRVLTSFANLYCTDISHCDQCHLTCDLCTLQPIILHYNALQEFSPFCDESGPHNAQKWRKVWSLHAHDTPTRSPPANGPRRSSMIVDSVEDANRCMHVWDLPSILGSSVSPWCVSLCLLYVENICSFVSVFASTIQF